MIPKKIHYCWFGGKPLPELALKCIDSWRRYMPDYEIVRWDESNFDVNACEYTREAYAVGKFAFVSDYARMAILLEHGGVYFDTDVEVIRDMQDVLDRGAFMGCEMPYTPSSRPEDLHIAPGLGIAAAPGMKVYREIVEHYHSIHFIKPDGSQNHNGIVPITTTILVSNGLKATPEIQDVEGITIYPYDWFNPLDDATGKLRKTENTHSIHWFMKSWIATTPRRVRISRMLHRIIGIEASAKLKRLLKLH